MDFTVQFSDEAIVEYTEAILGYDLQLENLSERFMTEIDNIIAVIRNKPLQFPILKKQFRQCVSQVFPFIIIYTVENDVIFVTSVFHTSRNPTIKFKKSK